jgi:hypothetical protein
MLRCVVLQELRARRVEDLVLGRSEGYLSKTGQGDDL